MRRGIRRGALSYIGVSNVPSLVVLTRQASDTTIWPTAYDNADVDPESGNLLTGYYCSGERRQDLAVRFASTSIGEA